MFGRGWIDWSFIVKEQILSSFALYCWLGSTSNANGPGSPDFAGLASPTSRFSASSSLIFWRKVGADIIYQKRENTAGDTGDKLKRHGLLSFVVVVDTFYEQQVCHTHGRKTTTTKNERCEKIDDEEKKNNNNYCSFLIFFVRLKVAKSWIP